MNLAPVIRGMTCPPSASSIGLPGPGWAGGCPPWTHPVACLLLVRPPGQLYGASYAWPSEMTSRCWGGETCASRARMQQVGQCGDALDVAEVVDDLQTLFDLPVVQPRVRHQRTVLGVDVGPGDAADAGPLRRVDGV